MPHVQCVRVESSVKTLTAVEDLPTARTYVAPQHLACGIIDDTVHAMP